MTSIMDLARQHPAYQVSAEKIQDVRQIYLCSKKFELRSQYHKS